MKRRIRIDWDDLEAAFSSRDRELVYYLDTVTGHVHLEGENDAFDEDEEDAAPPTRLSDDATRLYVEPPRREVLAGWMLEFLDSVAELPDETVAALRAGLDAEDSVSAVRAVLRDSEAASEQWFRYRSDRVHGLMEEWLRANDIEPTAPPPWG